MAGMGVTRIEVSNAFPADLSKPLRPRNYRPRRLVGVFIGFALFSLIPVIGSPGNPGFQLPMAALAALLLSVPALVLVWHVELEEQTVQIDTGSKHLRFAPRARVLIMPILAAIMGMLPAIVVLLLTRSGVPADGLQIGRRTVFGIGFLGVLWLAQQAWLLFRPKGLTLTPEGLTGVRGTKAVAISWEDLTSCRVISGRTTSLALMSKTRNLTTIDPHWIASDPRVVASIINYFAQHPAERDLLTDPQEAINAVDRNYQPLHEGSTE